MVRTSGDSKEDDDDDDSFGRQNLSRDRDRKRSRKERQREKKKTSSSSSKNRHRPNNNAHSSNGGGDGSCCSDEDSGRKKKRKKKRRGSNKRDDRYDDHRRRRRRDCDSDDDDDDIDDYGGGGARDESSESEDHKHRSDRKRRKRGHKKDPKKRRKKDRKKKRRRRSSSSDGEEDERDGGERADQTATADDDDDDEAFWNRNYALADALRQLLHDHPPMASDLPVILIRLAAGTGFGLDQMTDASASSGLANVFACLGPFGVQQEAGTGCWIWKGPSGKSSGQQQQELVLVKVVRTMLNQIGLTVQAVEQFEMMKTTYRKQQGPAAWNGAGQESNNKKAEHNNNNNNIDQDPVQQQVGALLKMFPKAPELAQELCDLCALILEGESIALDGLPDERVRFALESLFTECSLEKAEMENADSDKGQDDDDDDDDTDEDDEEPTMGYGLPEDNEMTARSNLSTVMQVCQDSIAGRKKKIKGPMPQPQAGSGTSARQNNFDDETSSDEDDFEGPVPVGGAPRGTSAKQEAVNAGARRRARELATIKAGLQPSDLPSDEDGGGREEWMLLPGKFDFLSAIKSGQARNRTFKAKEKGSGGGSRASSAPVDPAVQAELDSIVRAHKESRGQSLIDQHRQTKSRQKAVDQAAAAAGKKPSWKWNREKDLDEGRRVDKDALNMILGGAAGDLKTKFQGGFSSSR